jgi:hypothetical protein
MTHSAKIASIALALALGLPSLAAAQAPRTWVSGVGDDANPCSRTAPCKTFAGAISKTAAGGEISVLDPGGFGAVTITKSITINGDGTLAGILASSGASGIIVNAAASDVVILRSLSINGAGTGANGIRFLAGRALIVENSSIYGFTNFGIDVALPMGGNVAVKTTSITGGAAGFHVTGGTGVRTSLTDVTIKGAANGIDTHAGTTDVSNSIVSQNWGTALLAEGGVINAENTMLSGNGTGALAQTGAIIRLSNNSVYDNLTGFGCGGGTIASAGNNRKAGNAGGGAPVCSPNLAITLQ